MTMQNVKSNISAVLLTFNSDIRTGDYRRINLSKSPYRFPKSQRELSDDKVSKERMLAVWPGAVLPGYTNAQPPGLIKIDVEGFELEVLRGMKQTLKSAQLKCICVEVHFSILADRNNPDAPQEIVELFKDSGFLVAGPTPHIFLPCGRRIVIACLLRH